MEASTPSYDAMGVFVAVARAGSFTAAARTLGTPLSTVSRKVAALEAALAVQLFDRSRRRIRLTEAGAAYFALCRKGFDTLAYANRTVAERQSEAVGTLRITVPPNLVEALFLDPIESFQQRYPQARLRVTVSERMLDFVDDAIDLSFRVARPSRPDLAIRALKTHRHRLLAAPAYLAANPPPEAPAGLAGHHRLGFALPGQETVSWVLARDGAAEAVEFTPDLAVNDYAALRAALIRGLGVGELPGILCHEDLEAGRLTEVLPRWRMPEVTVYAVHTGRRGLTRLARLFLDIVAARLR